MESPWAITAFNTDDAAFALTETKRFATVDPLVKFLQSLRDADAANGRLVDAGLWDIFQRRCVKTNSGGDLMKDTRLQQR